MSEAGSRRAGGTTHRERVVRRDHGSHCRPLQKKDYWVWKGVRYEKLFRFWQGLKDCGGTEEKGNSARPASAPA